MPLLWKTRAVLHALASVVALATVVPASAQSASGDSYTKLGHDILRELIGINTTQSAGNTTVAAEAMAKRFRDAGFPAADVQVIGPRERNQNLIVRWRVGGSLKPILLLAHLDVVEARREDWSMDPFTLNEKDGFFYGRGTLDVKGGAATLVASLLRMKQEGFTPDRDIILALTAGEESSADYNGVRWLLENHRDLIDAEYCINVDAGGVELRQGKPFTFDVQASEKMYQSFQWVVRNPGGHSSLPVKRNAIYQLAAALERWSRYQFPPRMTDVTRVYFERMGALVGGKVGKDMERVAKTPLDTAAAGRLSRASTFYNALLRTTCVATLLEGGHAENALPQKARAVVNCRMVPGEKPDDVRRTMMRVAADTAVAIDTTFTSVPSPPSPLTPALLQSIQRVVHSMWPGVPVIPTMETGGTDGLWLRNAGMPVYGVDGIAYDPDDVRAHGKDERIGVKAYDDGLELTYRLLKEVTSGVKP